MSAGGYHIVFTLCAIALLGAASMCSTRDGPRFIGGIFATFALGMLVTTHMLGIGWTAAPRTSTIALSGHEDNTGSFPKSEFLKP